MGELKLKVGVIGLGEAAQIIHLPLLDKMADYFEILALCDVSPSLLQFMGQKYRVPAERLYEDYHSLVRLKDLDVVFVLNSNEYHKDCAEAAIRQGKHVLIEKPMCLTMEEAEAIIRLKNEAGVQVMVGYMRRYAPAYLAALEEVGKLDEINYVKIRDVIGENHLFIDQSSTVYRPDDIPPHLYTDRDERRKILLESVLGNGASEDLFNHYQFLCGLGCHDLSAMREMLGMPKQVLSAVSRKGFLHVVFDYGNFMACYETGVDQQIRFDAHIEVFGTNRTVKVQYDTPYIRQLPTTLTLTESDGDRLIERKVRPTYKDAYTVELEAFYDMVTRGRPPKTSAEDYMEDLRLFQMIIQELRA